MNDPAARNVTFDELKDAYLEQAAGLLEGGCDLFLVETIFDTLNAKAAIFALDELMEESGERLPVIVSGTVTDASGRILSGQTVTAFWHSVRHARPLAIGLNCALGAALMRPYVEELAKVAGDTFISCYPNAGLPNPMSETGFDETPEVTAGLMEEFGRAGFLNIAGGCCGTTPEHIAAIAERMGRLAPRRPHEGGSVHRPDGGLTLRHGGGIARSTRGRSGGADRCAVAPRASTPWMKHPMARAGASARIAPLPGGRWTRSGSGITRRGFPPTSMPAVTARWSNCSTSRSPASATPSPTATCAAPTPSARSTRRRAPSPPGCRAAGSRRATASR